MPKRVHEPEYAEKGPKDHWHAYSLQNLNNRRFTDVVRQILRGDIRLVTTKGIPDSSLNLR